jgi:hypothetical protein
MDIKVLLLVALTAIIEFLLLAGVVLAVYIPVLLLLMLSQAGTFPTYPSNSGKYYCSNVVLFIAGIISLILILMSLVALFRSTVGGMPLSSLL